MSESEKLIEKNQNKQEKKERFHTKSEIELMKMFNSDKKTGLKIEQVKDLQ